MISTVKNEYFNKDSDNRVQNQVCRIDDWSNIPGGSALIACI
jgi:hypothetical protein